MEQLGKAMDWKFPNPKNSAVITSVKVLNSEEWIAHVSHDEDDGGWQFLDRNTLDEKDARIVSLLEIVQLDPTVAELANLTIGWHAWRERKDAPWQRSK